VEKPQYFEHASSESELKRWREKESTSRLPRNWERRANEQWQQHYLGRVLTGSTVIGLGIARPKSTTTSNIPNPSFPSNSIWNTNFL